MARTARHVKEQLKMLETQVVERVELSEAERWFEERASELQETTDGIAFARREYERAAILARSRTGQLLACALDREGAGEGSERLLAQQKTALQRLWTWRLNLPGFYEMHVKELALYLAKLPPEFTSLLLAEWAACERLSVPGEAMPTSIDSTALPVPLHGEIDLLVERMSTMAAVLRQAAKILHKEARPLSTRALCSARTE
jgi:hypothetical protein